MNPKATRLWTVLGVALLLVLLNGSIFHKERIQRDGELVYLQLAPVDPRSLIQGDYMALRFQLVEQMGHLNGLEGDINQVPVVLDAQRVASLDQDPSAAGLKLRYRIRNGQIWLGTNAFFFEEGRAERYAKARYGEFRVDRETGEAVLVGLRDAQLLAL